MVVKYEVKLTDKQLELVKKKAKNTTTNMTLRKRCEILIDVDKNHGKVWSQSKAAMRNKTHQPYVSKIVKMFVQEGLEGVLTIKRNDASNHTNQKVTGEDEAKLIQIALSDPPEGHARWSLRLLEEKAKVVLEHPIKKDAIGRLLKKINFNLKKTNTGQSQREVMENL